MNETKCPSCGGEVNAAGFCVACKKRVKAGMSPATIAIAVVVGLVALGAVAQAMKGDESQASSTESTATPETATPPAPPPPPGSIEWLAQARNWCSRYDPAPNEIKKSDVFREGMKWITDGKLVNVRGTLRSIVTNQGGDKLSITVVISDGGKEATFETEGIVTPIKRGSAVYKQVAELQEGACVVVSADRIEPSSVLERSKICDDDYFARFTSVKPCSK